ncbi:hypothetical protein SAMN04488564_12091 [Lentzea waywayandensis]|uniref:Uncharacterized protein n=1 Tax=Lentzea waywayandensis TaxID=84724 RepID=A0A1I6FI93_9PSEU|nr:hypothetical protein SAMN04488564_12091 [Lentzea waywayandensis]
MPFADCVPVRGFPSCKGQRHLDGRWWTATTGTLVGYESWWERDRLVLLAFDPDVAGIASQPFWLFGTKAEGKARSHDPDYFARLADRSALVLDVRAADRIKPRDQVAFDATAEARKALGRRYEVVGAPPEALPANVRSLNALLLSEYLRPNPAGDLTCFDTATEPAPWGDQDKPRPSRAGQPWFPGS